ncbi:cytochrome b561 [Inquilinus ginsengisoli]|uniref:Cytochrome b561 n=1 Tax=Inquilinus ginsengisoli TaxID=363840 RepID=A0ABU1JQA9_9PROT|nr:cytochrome b [Inquilinus ginsengisoli]MDR6290502.1 cytochrome b561 [Inquilinus ginsengisoli]
MTADTPSMPAAARPQGRYDTTTIVLHWLTAVLVVVMFALPQIWQQFERRTPPRLWLIDLHFSLGITLAGLLLVRILWRAALGGRLPQVGPGPARVASRIVHLAFYILLPAQVTLGVLLRWAQQQPLPYFGLFVIPDPFAMPLDARTVLGLLHEWNAWVIIVLSGGHAAAALLHHYVLRDGLLLRMTPKR